MDKFLADLYQEEQEKVASAELDAFLDSQPLGDLEALLGIQKVAVGGPTIPTLPTALPGNKLDQKQKLVDEFSAKNRVEEPPTREQSEEVSHSNYEGPAKTAATAVEKMLVGGLLASGAGLAANAALKARQKRKEQTESKTAGCMSKTDEFTTPQAKSKAKAMATVMKAGKGLGTDKRKALVSATAKQMQKKAARPTEVSFDESEVPAALSYLRGEGGLGDVPGNERAMISQRMGEAEAPFAARHPRLSGAISGGLGGMLGGALASPAVRLDPNPLKNALLGSAIGGLGGAGVGALMMPRAMRQIEAAKNKESEGVGDGAGMGENASQGIETTASVRAKIAARALRATKGAPDHMRKVAAAVAGSQMAKVAAFGR